MDFVTDMAFAVVFRILKDKKAAQKVEAALMKLHGKIEDLYPFLKIRTEQEDSEGR